MSAGKLIPPANERDVRERVARFSSLVWSLEFAGDGSISATDFLRSLDVQWSDLAELADRRPSWVVAVLLDANAPGDQ